MQEIITHDFLDILYFLRSGFQTRKNV